MHQEKPRARVPLNQAGGLEWVRAADNRRAEVHLHRHIPLARHRAQTGHHEIAEPLPLGSRRILLAPRLARHLLVRFIKCHVAVIGQCVFERHLVARTKAIHEFLQRRHVAVEGGWLQPKPRQQGVRLVAVMIQGASRRRAS